MFPLTLGVFVITLRSMSELDLTMPDTRRKARLVHQYTSHLLSIHSGKFDDLLDCELSLSNMRMSVSVQNHGSTMSRSIYRWTK
jgi:hypothetical protein